MTFFLMLLLHIKESALWPWWLSTAVSSLRRLRWEDHKSQASLGYIARPGLKNIYILLCSIFL
jgi:hypothetical protein